MKRSALVNSAILLATHPIEAKNHGCDAKRGPVVRFCRW